MRWARDDGEREGRVYERHHEEMEEEALSEVESDEKNNFEVALEDLKRER